jgi:hypothetical protein
MLGVSAKHPAKEQSADYDDAFHGKSSIAAKTSHPWAASDGQAGSAAVDYKLEIDF